MSHSSGGGGGGPQFSVTPIAIIVLWIISIFLWYLDVFVWRFNGYDLGFFMSSGTIVKLILGVFQMTSIVAIVFAPFAFKDNEYYRSLLILFGTFFLIIFLGLNGPGVAHIFMAILFWVTFHKADPDKAHINVLVSIILLIDFVGYGTLSRLPLGLSVAAFSRVVFPIWTFFIVGYGMMNVPSNGVTFIFVLTALFYFFVALDGLAFVNQGSASMLDQATISSGVSRLQQGAVDMVFFIPNAISTGVQSSIQYATGDYYTGTVEDNEKEPLGVFLEDVELADSSYQEGDVVNVWGNIRAKTFDMPIQISLSCTAEDRDENIYTGRIMNPKTMPFVVAEYSEAPFLCSFGNLGTGYYDITVTADFNFETLSYMRVYFMRGDTLLAKKRELRDNGNDDSNSGVLTSYGLPTSYSSVYTNGPVGLGIGTTEPPIRIDPETGVQPYFGVSVNNDWSGGIIRQLTKLELLVPEPITLDLGSCGNDVFTPTGVDSSRGESGYNKYSYQFNRPDKSRDITDYASFRCLMNVGYNALDNTPVTVRNLKVNAGYTYALEKTLTVDIKPNEGDVIE